jgi:hypothetical protein
LGLTWLATVPPTAALVGKLFGVRYLSTLFGITLLSHQIGGFLGAWLGGVAVVEWGSYNSMWVADMLLAAVAAVANLLDLRLAVVAGSVALGFGDPFFAAANDEIALRAQLDFSKGCELRRGGLGADGPLIGAAAVGWRGLDQ